MQGARTRCDDEDGAGILDTHAFRRVLELVSVREYQRAPATEVALYLMAVSYDKLGLPLLRDDAERVLKQNYPNTKFFKDGVRLPERAWWQFW